MGGPGVEHLGEVEVVHHREPLAVGLEAGEHLLGVSMTPLTILSATMREIGSFCSAIQTVPKPPSPICGRSV